jgi:hypothetical protein
MTSSRGGLRERPPPNLDIASLTTRWESRAQKDSFFFLPYSSDSYSVHRIGSYRNQKIGDDKFERRPWRAPPQILTSPASPGGGNRAHKKILFFSLPCSSDSYSCCNQKMRLKMTELQISTKVKIKLQIYKKMKIELHIYKEI